MGFLKSAKGVEPRRETNGNSPVFAASRLSVTLFLVLALCFTDRAFTESAGAQDVSEYQVKAAFLYNFAKFVEWPGAAEPSPDGFFVIGILGKDPFGSTLDLLVKTKTVMGRHIEVKRFTRVEDVHGCQMVFISASEARKLPATIKALNGMSVLTVSEVPQFLEAGGMLNLILAGNRVAFEANPRAAEREGFRLSSKLLQLAVNLRGAPQP
jgi:hypothetical protein